ncbi:MAG: DUF2087 domain-containing protein, partial [Acidimicrobiales bacterium]
MDASTIVRLLADPDRRRVFAALTLGASTLDDVRTMTGLGVRSAATALERLVAHDLVVRGSAGEHFVMEEVLRQAAIDAVPAEPDDEHGDAPPDVAKVLRSFVRDRRLVSVPAQRSKRLVILDLLAQDFEPGRRYPEREVNQILRRWNPDTATLRRFLVDEDFMERDASIY